MVAHPGAAGERRSAGHVVRMEVSVEGCAEPEPLALEEPAVGVEAPVRVDNDGILPPRHHVRQAPPSEAEDLPEAGRSARGDGPDRGAEPPRDHAPGEVGGGSPRPWRISAT